MADVNERIKTNPLANQITTNKPNKQTNQQTRRMKIPPGKVINLKMAVHTMSVLSEIKSDGKSVFGKSF